MRFVVAAVVAGWLAIMPAAAQQFFGELVLKPLPDGVHMLVQKEFGFIDKQNLRWPVAVGYKSDGASIPRALWTLVGSPFTGKYLPAAVIHDFYCERKDRPWKVVHLTFYDAMIANGVDTIQAKLMYYAVYRFGPKWLQTRQQQLVGCDGQEQRKEGCTALSVTKQTTVLPDASASDTEVASMADAIRRDNIDLGEIRARSDRSFLADARALSTRTVIQINPLSSLPGPPDNTRDPHPDRAELTAPLSDELKRALLR